MRRVLLLALALSAAWPATAGAWPPVGDGIATSPAGHVAVLRGDGLHVAGPDRRFGPPEKVRVGDFVAVGPRGDVLVVGHRRVELPRQPDGSLNLEFQLWAAYRPPGGPLEPPVRLGISSSFGEDWPALGIDATGTAAVIWATNHGSSTMMASTRAPGGAWQTQHLGGEYVFRPSLSVSDNGLMTAAWRQSRPDRVADTLDEAVTAKANQAAVATRLPGGAFGPASVVAGVQRDPGEVVVASNSRGDAVVAWSQIFERKPRFRGDFDTGFAVHAAFRRGLGPFTGHRRVSRIEAANPSLAVADSGRMVMTWAGDRHVEARVRSAAGALHPPVRVSRNREQNSTSTAYAEDGGLVAFFDRDPGRTYTRWAPALPDGRFGRARTVHRSPEFGDWVRVMRSPTGPRAILGFGRPTLLQTTPLRR